MKKVFISLLLFTLGLHAEFDKVGTASALFLKIPSGARGAAIGTAVTAFIDDGSSALFNPAGYAISGKRSAAFSYNPYLLDIRQTYFSYVMPVTDNTAAAFSVLNMSTGTQEITTVRQEDGTGEKYSINDLAAIVSFSGRVSDRLYYGLNVKYISLNIMDLNAKAFAVDISSILQMGIKGISIGMAMSNFGNELSYSNKIPQAVFDGNNDEGDDIGEPQSWPLPLGIRLGLAFQLLGDKESQPLSQSSTHSLILAVDAYHPNDNDEQLNLGVEYAWLQRVFLRSGYQINSDIYGASFGGGLNIPLGNERSLGFDYAWLPLKYFGNSSQFSLNINF